MNRRFPTKDEIEFRKNLYKQGTRIELIEMNDPYSKLKSGERGFVRKVDDIGTVHIDWDCGSRLGAVYGEDAIRVVPPLPDKVYEQIMAVRSAGACNMLDTTAVQRYANDNDLYELVIFIEEYKSDYVDFIFRGKK